MEFELKEFKRRSRNGLQDDLAIPETNDQVLDVTRGVGEYDAISNELELESHQFIHPANGNSERDLEANVPMETEEDFKLRKYFENSQRMAMENGGKPKKMGVSIRNLTVKGKGADVSVIPDMSAPFYWFASLFNPSSWKKSNGTTFDILHDVNAYAQDGKMLLVLGRPGAGCSTFLRVISNQRDSYVSVNGEVTYGGISAKEWKRYRGEAIYTPEEDIHYPTLTLRDTLDFALKCKTPGNRLPDEKKATFRTKIFDLLVNMFGIAKQADTVVGNEFMRGLSGGERKRLTIAEAMVSSASITCWDCSTRGLDAASALDYAKSLRIMSDTLDKTTIASFYQASDSIYSLFDNVLILEKGRCIYFGPGNKAKQYFLDIGFDCEPRKSIPDFLTGVTNPQERIIRPGFESTAPETSADFEAVWKKSQLYNEMLESQTIYEAQIEKEQPSVQFIQQVRDEKSRTNHKKSAYTTSFVTQVVALTQRNLQILWGDKFSIISRYLSILIQSFIYGSVFFQLANDGSGVFTRGGALFSSLLFNAFLSEAELPMTFIGRRILQKHRSYALYRPSALHIAQIVTDLPIVFAQVFLWAIIVYFMFGLQYDAGKFFVFCFILIGITLAMTNLFRVFGNFCPSLYIAQNILNAYLIFMITYVGYTIPYQKMKPWFQWFFWINPMAYSFKALMANEFRGLEFNCSSSAVPSGPSYTDLNGPDYSANRICSIPGASSGQFIFQGEDYMKAGLDFKSDDLALNTIVVYLWWLLFIVLNMFAMEFFDWTSGGYTSKVYKRGKAPKLNDADDERQQMQIVRDATSKMKETLKMRGGVFTWQNIEYTVPVAEGTRLLLDNIEGWIKPGQMTALMGSSGAGKTTLLDVLAKRKTIGEVKGISLLNGKPLDVDFERITGYVEQMDVHNPGLTVRESLQFSAKLRQEPSVSIEEKYAYVEHVLEMMEMKHLGDALIGSLENGVGISVEERKRLTIGVELVAKPHILFLDEPTSGLDAQSSYNIVKFIRKLADAGMPLVCTIHQPSSVLFEHFDRLLLLAKGGKTVYFGDIGEKSSTMTSYFERHGVRPCTESENPAEYILEAIGAGVHGKSNVDWPAAWRDSPERTSITAELAEIQRTAPTIYTSDENGPAREFSTSIWYQTMEVYKHLNLIWWRDPFYTFGSFVQSILCALILAFTFYDLKNSSSDMEQRMFLIFEALILGILVIYVCLPQFLIQKEYFKRDYASKFYSWFPFAISIVIVEIPYTIISGSLFFFIIYWTCGIDSTGENGFYFWIMFMMMLLFMCSFGQAVGAVCVNMFLAFTIVPLLIIFLFLFCGVMVPYQSIPYFWRSWIYHLNPATYIMEGLITSVLKNVDITCETKDLIPFTAPDGYTCDQYNAIGNFTTNNMGNIHTFDDGSCGYCTYKSGTEYFENVLSWDSGHRWRNFGVLTGFWVFNIFMVIGFVYLSKRAKR